MYLYIFYLNEVFKNKNTMFSLTFQRFVQNIFKLIFFFNYRLLEKTIYFFKTFTRDVAVIVLQLYTHRRKLKQNLKTLMSPKRYFLLIFSRYTQSQLYKILWFIRTEIVEELYQQKYAKYKPILLRWHISVEVETVVLNNFYIWQFKKDLL